MDSTESFSNRPPDPFVAARVGDPAEPPKRLWTLAGLLGDSDLPGKRRLYLTMSLDYFVEFEVDEVVGVEDVPSDEPPFPGLDATRVNLSPDATVRWVHRRRPGLDPFSLDGRFDRYGLLPIRDDVVLPRFTHTGACSECFTGTGTRETCDPPFGGVSGCPCLTNFGPAPTRARTDATCNQATCFTCRGGTCDTCGEHTCRTCVAECHTRAETCAGCRANTLNTPCA